MATRVGIHTATTASRSGRWSLLLCRYVDLPKAFGQRARPELSPVPRSHRALPWLGAGGDLRLTGPRPGRSPAWARP